MQININANFIIWVIAIALITGAIWGTTGAMLGAGFAMLFSIIISAL